MYKYLREKEVDVDTKARVRRLMVALDRECGEESGTLTEFDPDLHIHSPETAFNPKKGTRHIKPFWSKGRF